MSLSENRHQEQRIIKKRLKIAESHNLQELGIRNRYVEEPHRLHKFNLNCGCKQCHYYKNCGNSKAKYKHRDKKMYEQSNQVIND